MCKLSGIEKLFEVGLDERILVNWNNGLLNHFYMKFLVSLVHNA